MSSVSVWVSGLLLCVFAGALIYGLRSGQVRSKSHVFTREADPIGYWVSIGGLLAGMVFLLASMGLSLRDATPANHVTSAPPVSGRPGCPIANDLHYGYAAHNPIRVGGGPTFGPRRAQAYVNNLVADNARLTVGEHGYILQNSTTLDFYAITVGDQRQLLYFDYTSYETPQAPVGLQCRGALTFTGP